MDFRNFLMKSWFVFLCTVFFITNVFTQAINTKPQLNNSLIPPSPDVAAIAKYGIVPVTMYTGMADVSVPVTELKTSKLNLPISLGYNYNGYRPGEEASWVGLGWSLQADGVITRIVKGKVDEDANVTHWKDYANIGDLTSDPNFLDSMGRGYIDAEPDLYIFNFNGHSGKFLLVGSRAYTFPRQSLRISNVGNGFVIVAEDGSSYEFYDTETTTPFNQSPEIGYYTGTPSYISSWHLTRIISADKTDTISYQYTTRIHRLYDLQSETYLSKSGNTDPYHACLGSNNACDAWSVSTAAGPSITTKRLTKITSKMGYINFLVEGGGRLDVRTSSNDTALKEIDIYNYNSVLIKKIKLTHGYFQGATDFGGTNSQLKLNSVEVWAIIPIQYVTQHN
ncbi:MAG TPA: hypothetical protein PLA68_10045 [Panacibacter sp.]|nr:hypothetical protein [Panacibacter sp.]